MNDLIEFHPYANIFPMLDGQQWEDFKKNIAEKGVLDPVILFEGKILDGRNRYKAATELDAECRFENYSGDDPLAFVLSHNLHRRHLNEAQRAAVGAKVATLEHGTNRFAAKVEGSIDPSIKKESVTIKEAARMLNISEPSVKRAKRILREAEPEVVEAVERGNMSLHAALKTLKEDKPVDNVVPIGVEKQKPLTQKQLDIRKTKEYTTLNRKYQLEVKRCHDLELELRAVLDENRRLRGKLSELGVEVQENGAC